MIVQGSIFELNTPHSKMATDSLFFKIYTLLVGPRDLISKLASAVFEM